MASAVSRILRWPCLLGAFFLCPLFALAQGPTSAPGASAADGVQGTESGPNFSSTLDISVQDESGGGLLVMAVVTLTRAEGKFFQQANSDAGHVEFDGLTPGRYTIQVTAQGYASLKQTIDVAGRHTITKLQLNRSGAEDIENAAVTGVGNSARDAFGMTTAVGEQRQMLKIAQALRDNKPQRARLDLEKLYLHQPTDANLNYLFGEYSKQIKDLAQAKSYWQRAVALDPKFLAAWLELGRTALDEGKPAEALPYLKRAAQASPTSWQPHAMMVLAHSKLKQLSPAVEEAERALDLGHREAAAIVQPVLASTLAAEGNKEQAIQILQKYLQEHPDAYDAWDLLSALRQPIEAPWPSVPLRDPLTSPFDIAPILPSAWMPANVDDKIPPVESGVPCSLDTVLNEAGKRLTQLVEDLERFEATEFLEDERMGRAGLPSRTETRTYRYMVSIQEPRPGLLAVNEYRSAQKEQYDAPDGIVTVGLPALALVFHPAQSPNYHFTCEGLARFASGLAWQVHFQQRADRIPTLHAYSRGNDFHPVGLKGRAWIAADTFQIVGLESDLVKSYPEIQLRAEHTWIAYGPVRFRAKDVRLWLPQKAEVYFDWRGKRVHRVLSYSKYSLFSVDSTQKISPPKNAAVLPQDSPAASAPVKPE